MSVIVRQVLPADAGVTLPATVRQALVDHGLACNIAAAAVNQAAVLDQQANAREDDLQVLGRGDQVSRAAADIAEATDRFHTLALVALARAATAYAVCASQLAAQVIAGEQVTDAECPAGRLKPSDVITAAGLYLPRLIFTPRHQDEQQQVADLNADVRRSYAGLNNVITHQLHGVDAAVYDDLGAAAALDPTVDVPEVFPGAIYDYAATVSWTVGMLTGVAEDV
ncbi:hypothetical protein [Paractinoplanes toevensis]|uniref:Uncharacterized protein n=1 Tax=Paractinoplanes toevensis TaxID=571911 RepID=A0A919W5N1_9ACTN|nr:hypothetical protein [Actinoplanes toevensis]GIM93200.1 hypothetical protein Ato02nite_049930 [Actinoplanes toevensis]